MSKNKASDLKLADSKSESFFSKLKNTATYERFFANLKKSRKKIKSTLIIISCITLLLIFYFGFIHLRFSIKEDLLINIPERHIDMNITQENPANLEIFSTVQTSVFCKASCTQKLVNVNSNEVIFSQTFEFKRFYRIYFEKTIYPYILGEGQDIYAYSISCTNIATANCPVKDSLVEKNIIITLNRELTEQETTLKNTQEAVLNETYSVFNNGSLQTDLSDSIIQQLQYAKKDDLEQELYDVQKKKTAFNNSLSAITDAWLTYNHSLTEQMLKKEDISSLAYEFGFISSLMYTDTLLRIENHNYAVNTSFNLAKEIFDSKNILKQSKQFLGTNYISLNSELNEATSLSSFSSKSIYNKDFNTYSDIFAVLDSENISINIFKENYLDMFDNYLFTKSQLDLLILEEDVCFIINQRANENKSSAVSNTSNLSECSEDFSEFLINYSASYDNLSASVLSFCADYTNLINAQAGTDNSTLSLREELSDEALNTIDIESAKYRIYNLKKHKQELILRNDSFANISIKIIDTYIASLELKYNLSQESIQVNAFSSTFNKSLIAYFNKLNFTFENITQCEPLETELNLINLSYEPTPVINISIDSGNYNSSLSELLPRACFDGICKPYVDNESKNYPLIIVHGHGFYSKNSRITPSQVHNELQSQLFQDKLYVPAGILRYDDSIIQESLGNIDIPFVYKAAYYPEEILDNESINLFADRLNIIILNAKKETGKDKVILIVHSMGGLVTRTYLKKYGTNDVESVIIGGTPNYGVTSDTVSLCKLFGRNLECDEMYEKSEFILNLETEPNYNIPIYTLRGVGCSTFGDDGDGIVQSKRVPLPYAENFAFNGTCSLTGDFHVNLLNPKQNPLIYNKIKEILIENN